jgi:hypothetical protein
MYFSNSTRCLAAKLSIPRILSQHEMEIDAREATAFSVSEASL